MCFLFFKPKMDTTFQYGLPLLLPITTDHSSHIPPHDFMYKLVGVSMKCTFMHVKTHVGVCCVCAFVYFYMMFVYCVEQDERQA